MEKPTASDNCGYSPNGCKYAKDGHCAHPNRSCPKCGYFRERCDISPFSFGHHQLVKIEGLDLSDIDITYAKCPQCGYIPPKTVNVRFDLGSVPEAGIFRLFSLPAFTDYWTSDHKVMFDFEESGD